LTGRKPINRNLSVGRPEAGSAASIALAPGTLVTKILSWIAEFTNL